MSDEYQMVPRMEVFFLVAFLVNMPSVDLCLF